MNGIAEAFITGARDLVTGALVIGVAYGILVIFQYGRILDTILVNHAELIGHLPPWLSAVGMFFFMAALVSARVPWIKWVRWMLPLIAVQVTIAIAAVVFAHLIGYS